MTIRDVRAMLADDTVSDRGVLAAMLDLLETLAAPKPEPRIRRETHATPEVPPPGE